MNPYTQELVDAPLIPITATVHGKKREVGVVQLDIFFKYINGSRHILRSPEPAIAFDLDSIEQIKKAGATHLLITDRIGYTKYRATMETLLEKGFPIHRRGQEKQLALAMRYWDIEAGGQPKPSTYETRKRTR